MNGASHLLNRNRTYYFQRRVPDEVKQALAASPDRLNELPPDLLDYFKGRDYIRHSLKTKDKREGTQRCLHEDLKFNGYVSRVQQWASSAGPIFDHVPPETIRALAQTWTARALQADEDWRIAGVTLEEIDHHELGALYVEDGLQEALIGTANPSSLPAITQAADGLLRDFQINLDKTSSEYLLLNRELVKAFLYVSQARQERNRGELIDTPPEPPKEAIKAPTVEVVGSMNLEDLLGYWKGLGSRNWKTAYDMQTAIDEFKALHGDLAIDQITKAHVIAYRDNLMGIGVEEGKHKPRSSKTIEKRLTMLRALLQVAVDNDKIKFNPCQGVKVPKEKVTKKTRVAFTEEDLKAIFAGPVHTGGKLPKGAAGPAGYWMPLLALYMGVRLGEAAQITKEDVKHEKGIDYVLVTNEAEGQQLKTESSKRRVPIHPDLIALGFLEFVQKVPDGERLFPLVVKYRDQWGKAWSQWCNRYLSETIGIADSQKVVHSFRHTFKDLCRKAGITEEVHDALTGHSNGGVGRMYGGENFPLEPLAEAIKKITVGVKLGKQTADATK